MFSHHGRVHSRNRKAGSTLYLSNQSDQSFIADFLHQIRQRSAVLLDSGVAPGQQRPLALGIRIDLFE
jgi:hypothetical protein